MLTPEGQSKCYTYSTPPASKDTTSKTPIDGGVVSLDAGSP